MSTNPPRPRSIRMSPSPPTSPSITTRSPRRCPSRAVGSWPVPRCSRGSALELGELVAVLAAHRVRFRARESELLADLGDLGALLAADRAVGGGHRVEAREQIGALLARRDQAELARDEVVLRTAEIARLALCDLHHERRLG